MLWHKPRSQRVFPGLLQLGRIIFPLPLKVRVMHHLNALLPAGTASAQLAAIEIPGCHISVLSSTIEIMDTKYWMVAAIENKALPLIAREQCCLNPLEKYLKFSASLRMVQSRASLLAIVKMLFVFLLFGAAVLPCVSFCSCSCLL